MTSVSSVSPFGARYLEDPRTFPRRSEGGRWGEGTLVLSVGGDHYAVRGLSPAQGDTLRAMWPDFVREEPAPDAISLSVFRTPVGSFRTFARWVYDLELDYREGSIRMAGLDLMARLELAPAISGAVWVATENPETFHA